MTATPPHDAPRHGRPAAPPAPLDPLFAVIERIDRRRRHIRPMRPEAVLGVEIRRHRGSRITLRDGTTVDPGDRIADLHLDNRRVGPLWDSGWRVAFGTAGRDLRAYAAEVAGLPPDRRPVALRSGGLLSAGAARLGFEVGPARGGFMGALENWYLRGLMVRWNRTGRRRLERGRHALRTHESWLSTPAFLLRYGSVPGDGTGTPPAGGEADG